MTGRITELAPLRERCWAELRCALEQHEHGWRHWVLATAGAQGADARTVVLRDVAPHQQRLAFYSDSRSAKVAQLRADARATLVAYSQALAWQLRLAVRVDVLDSGLDVSSRWARLKLTPSASDYLSPLPPGTPLARPMPERSSREHFCVLWAEVLAIDWVELHRDGHRRARFDAEGARWLVP